MFLKRLSVFILLLTLSRVSAQTFFPVPDADAANFSPFSQTGYLLNASTKTNPLEVRILVYGQSISAQDWWKDVKKFLETRYPDANINMINIAIGGFSSDRLKLMVENDVTSFYPDLILFHDYGGEFDYETILKTIRSKTTAEIAAQTDHVALGGQEWHDKHAETILPALCKKYGLALIDIRKYWKKYLNDNKLEAKALLSDNVHLNEHGNYLMAGIIKSYLNHIPVTKKTGESFKIFTADRHFKTNKKGLQLEVEGNRVDIVFKKSAQSVERITVRVDGKKPSQFIGSFYYSRPQKPGTGWFLSHMGQPLAMKLNTPIEEEYSLTITKVDTLKPEINFTLQGSKTGNDGSGSSRENFTSTSGKINIGSGNWFYRRSPGDFSMFSWLKPRDIWKWEIKQMGLDTLIPDPAQRVYTVIQGIDSRKHRLELYGKSLRNIKEIRVL